MLELQSCWRPSPVDAVATTTGPPKRRVPMGLFPTTESVTAAMPLPQAPTQGAQSIRVTVVMAPILDMERTQGTTAIRIPPIITGTGGITNEGVAPGLS